MPWLTRLDTGPTTLCGWWRFLLVTGKKVSVQLIYAILIRMYGVLRKAGPVKGRSYQIWLIVSISVGHEHLLETKVWKNGRVHSGLGVIIDIQGTLKEINLII